ncbi:MAG: hypothetical protein MRY83_19550 [Flavobacteriales bacterium]|nr:hypothetical protein [Flavobacteriales bacterium]
MNGKSMATSGVLLRNEEKPLVSVTSLNKNCFDVFGLSIKLKTLPIEGNFLKTFPRITKRTIIANCSFANPDNASEGLNMPVIKKRQIVIEKDSVALSQFFTIEITRNATATRTMAPDQVILQ